MKKYLILLLVLSATGLLYAQQTERWRGIVIDTERNRPIGDCRFYIGDSVLRAVSRENGTFELDIDCQKEHPASLTVHCLGYESLTFELTDYQVDLLFVGMQPVEIGQDELHSLHRQPLQIYHRSILPEFNCRFLPGQNHLPEALLSWEDVPAGGETYRRLRRHRFLISAGLIE
jgi:hypothetical protein